MITITVKEDNQKFQQTFHKEKIIIGSGPPNKVDLPLMISNLSEDHIVISLKNGKYQVVNSTHDPLVLLNQLAFGSRTLREGDTLFIHGSVLKINKVKHPFPPKAESSLVVEQSEEIQYSSNKAEQKPEEESTPLPNNPIQIKSYHPSHFLAIIAATLIFLLGSGIYISFVNDRIELNEADTALFVSDAGMALMYAKLYQIHAPRENWSSPEFLKENLKKMLAFPESSTISSLSVDGWLQNTPYLIRIYTAQNLRRFLVIAQPSSRKSHFFTSKTAIVMDSEQMELRKLDDIVPLNRILADPKVLDSEDAKTVSSIVQSGKLLTLKEIGVEKNRPELIPPRGLGFIRPRADLKVYNAPRYYKLTDWVVREAAKLKIPEEGTISSLPPFFEELQHLSSLNDLVYYTTEEIETALHAYEIFHLYLPQEEMLVGWLSLNPDTKQITNSLLITLKGTPHVKNQSEKTSSFNAPSSEVDMHSKWFEEMMALRKNRTKSLDPLAEAMSLLLKQHTQEPDPNFDGKFDHLQKNYLQMDQEEISQISRKIHELYREYREKEDRFSPTQFLQYVRLTGIEFFVHPEMMKELEQDEIDRLAKDKVDHYMKRLKGAQKFSELEKHANSCSEFLEQSLASKELKLRVLQSLRDEIYKKLHILLSPDDAFHLSYRIEDRDSLEQLLHHRKIATEEEELHYLKIFDQLITMSDMMEN